jgi:RNA polymerase sigma factor (sigma-70 family)
MLTSSADSDPITALIAGLKRSDEPSIARLWELYFRRVAGLARRVLGDARGAADEEDVAQSAFRSFCLRAGGSGFPRLNDRRDLWSLLATITFRKALKQIAREAHQIPTIPDAERALANQPDHEFLVELRDEIQRLMGLIDEEERRIAGLIMSGHTNEEIARLCGFSRTKVERKRKLIRETWRRASEA